MTTTARLSMSVNQPLGRRIVSLPLAAAAPLLGWLIWMMVQCDWWPDIRRHRA